MAATGGVADALCIAGYSVEKFPHSLNSLFPGSRLRFQLTPNDRYGNFPISPGSKVDDAPPHPGGIGAEGVVRTLSRNRVAR